MAVFYNQATLSYNGNVTSSNIVTGEIAEVLTASKNAVIDTYSSDNDIVFVIGLVNDGEADFTNLTVTDDLGRYTFSPGEGLPDIELTPLTYEEGSVTYYVNGVQQPAPTVTDTDPLTITGIDVPAGGNAIILYAAKANQFAPLGAGDQITNTAVISGLGLCDPVSVSETITPAETADLAISKSLDPVTIPENGELTYTFILQNYGNTAASENDSVIFRDAFDPAISISSVTFDGEEWTEGVNYEYDETTGVFTSNEGQITVPAAEFTQDPTTGAWTIQPGTSTLVISGSVICSPSGNDPDCTQTANKSRI